MIDLIGLIVLAILQGIHVYHDYLKFKSHESEMRELTARHDELRDRGDRDDAK